MSYSVDVSNSAKKSLAKLDRGLQERIRDFMLDLVKDPWPKGVRKVQSYQGVRGRVGAYRVVYTVDKKKKRVLIEQIRHRDQIYRKRS